MKLCNIGHRFDYEIEKLIRIFLPFEKIEICHTLSIDTRLAVLTLKEDGRERILHSKLIIDGAVSEKSCKQFLDGTDCDKVSERLLATLLYECFVELTEYVPAWGILTGVRPAKLFSRLCDSMGNEAAERYFSQELRVSENKISLCKEAVSGEKKITSLSRPQSFSLYLSIPFCPTRCSYCSFVSHSVDKAKNLIPSYVERLCAELKETAVIAHELGLKLETVYMGGGTPTALSADQLNTVLSVLGSKFDLSRIREYTVEAGRPDTITAEKLNVIKNSGATRISINPQTLNDRVLEEIGRKHTAQQAIESFRLARNMGFNNINMDLIAGLPTDTVESFENTLNDVLQLDPESVTVHSLSMKRASALSVGGGFPEISAGEAASAMVDMARTKLTKNGILPYYMYRQSKTVGNLENVGYAKPGYECLYNVYIMDETHTILACGASAVTKLREPMGNYIKRIFNFKYPYEYIDRFDEQIQRKEGIREFYEKYPSGD